MSDEKTKKAQSAPTSSLKDDWIFMRYGELCDKSNGKNGHEIEKDALPKLCKFIARVEYERGLSQGRKDLLKKYGWENETELQNYILKVTNKVIEPLVFSEEDRKLINAKFNFFYDKGGKEGLESGVCFKDEIDDLLKSLHLRPASKVKEEVKEEIKEEIRKELSEKISQLENPYPEDVFVSVEGKAARNAYDCAKEDAIKAIKEARRE